MSITINFILEKMYCGKIIGKCKKHVEKIQFVAWHVLVGHFLNYNGWAEKVINYLNCHFQFRKSFTRSNLKHLFYRNANSAVHQSKNGNISFIIYIVYTIRRQRLCNVNQICKNLIGRVPKLPAAFPLIRVRGRR